MTDTITFIHAADLHLDSPFKGFSDVPEQVFQSMRESTFGAFDKLINTAIEKQVDFIVIVGDLFDENKQSLKAQLHLRDGFIRLQKYGIEVFISYGNHDYIAGNTYPIHYPDNVHIFLHDEVQALPFEKNGHHLANVYGFSYVNRDVKENKAIQYKLIDRSVPYHIAMLHGTLHGNQEHDPYAPFRLEDLAQETFDYWALGHIHKRSIIQENPPVVYPGNIQGRHRKETGPKGCYHVTLNQTGAQLDFISLQDVEILDMQLDLRKYEKITEIQQAIIKKVKDHSVEQELIYLRLVSDEIQANTLGLIDRLDELIDLINDILLEQHHWQYIYKFRLRLTDEEKVKVDTFFMKEIHDVLKEMDLIETVGTLYNHPQAKKQIQVNNEAEIIEQAIEYLTDEMSQKVR